MLMTILNNTLCR